jgi:hypothetical protein
MIQNIGEGYYGVEKTTHTISPSVLAQMNRACAEAMAISDNDIVIREYAQSPSAKVQRQTSVDASKR